MKPWTETISVVGAGAVGVDIARIASNAGHKVILCNIDPGNPDRADHTIQSVFRAGARTGGLSSVEHSVIPSTVSVTRSLRDVADTQIVIETIADDVVEKQRLLRELETLCGPETVFASSTSSLSITELASVLVHPERMLGLHFLAPAASTKLVEVVSGCATDRETARTMAYLITGWGRYCVHVRSTPGLILERVSRPYFSEALRLLQEQVVGPETLDAIMRESGGFRLGPLELMDLVGQDDNYAETRSVFDARFQDPKFRPGLVQRALIDAGRLGRKSGRGFFDYPVDSHGRKPDQFCSQAPPARLTIRGGLGVANSLRVMFSSAGIAVEQSEGAGVIEFGDTTLAMTDGRTATERAYAEDRTDLVLFDLVQDYSTSDRVAITRANQSSRESLAKAAGLFQSIGKTVSAVDDAPGMVVMRTVCMLANEGADAVYQGVCDVKAVDLTMRHGAGYPMGPLVWADRVGLRYVTRTLDNIRNSFGESRYRVSPLLRRKSLTGLGFYG